MTAVIGARTVFNFDSDETCGEEVIVGQLKFRNWNIIRINTFQFQEELAVLLQAERTQTNPVI
jgi:hypothetical protein